MELPGYTAIPAQTLIVSPRRVAGVEGIPVVRVEKETSAERHCTDTGSLLICASLLSLGLYITLLGLCYGSIHRVTRSTNSNGGICGSSPSSLAGYPYLYYPLDPTTSSPRLLPSARKCVHACPTESDVAARRVIPITRTQIERNSRGTSSTLLEYTVNTPVYASVPISGRLCFPVSSLLGDQMTQQFIESPLLTYRSVLSSLWTSSWIVMGVAICSFLFGLLHIWFLKTMPRLAIIFTTGTALWIGLVLGVSLITSSIRTAISIDVPTVSQKAIHTLWIPRPPAESLFSFLIGLLLLVAVVVLIVTLFTCKDLVTVVCRVNETLGDILAIRPNGGMMGSPSVISAGIGILSMIWIYVFTLLSGASTNSAIPQALSSQRNGSSLILSLERNDHLPLWAFLSLQVWLFTGFCVFEFLLCLLKFSVCYTATMWYFVEEPDAFEAPNPARLTPSLVSLSIGLLNHTGSFFLAGLWFGLTRPFRVVQSWINSRYYRFSTPQEETSSVATRVTDLLTANGFVEMAVASTPLNVSLKAARDRGLRPGSATGRLIGAASLGSTLTVVSSSLLAGIVTFSILSHNPDYASPTSKTFVPSPLFPTLVSMLLSAMVIAPHIECWAVLTDALLYCYLLESDVGGGNLDEDPSSKVHAPLPLRDLICEEQQLNG